MPEGMIINPFDTAGYDLATLTEAINIIPNQYGRVRQLGIFSPDPVYTDQVLVEEVNGHITLLPTLPKGAPATRKKRGKGKMRSFVVPHVPYEDQIFPADIQGRRQPGSIDPQSLEVAMMKSLEEMRGSHAITEEFMLNGAIQGILIDADGTEIYNWYDEFGIAQKSVAFALGTDSTNVGAKCREVVRHIEDNLLGEVMSGVHCLCGQDWFDKLISHPNVEEKFLYHQKALDLAGITTDPRKGFNYGGITFEEYRGKGTDPSTGSARKFIADTEAHFFPVGTMNTFKIHYAPANYLETVNTLGKPLYAKQTMEQKGRWVDINTESNLLPICRRPALLVKGTTN